MPGRSTPKPWWQQATALVSVSTSGVITGLAFAPGTPAELTTPGGAGLPLLALEQLTPPASASIPGVSNTGVSNTGVSSTAKGGMPSPAGKTTRLPPDGTTATPGPPAKASPAPPASASIPGLDSTPAGGPGPVKPAAALRRSKAPATIPQPNATAAIPGLATPSSGTRPGAAVRGTRSARRSAAATRQAATASIPGLVPPGAAPAAKPASAAQSPPGGTTPRTPRGTTDGRANTPAAARQAFIDAVAPGAIAAQHRYGVPASVTIAQAIEESAWGRSSLAARYHNLFGIKGSGPAGSALLPTSEYAAGQWVTVDAAFRAYHNDAQSIADHAELLATSGYYAHAMALRSVPDAFANALTGVYATDPQYGARLISLMHRCNLYQYDSAANPQAANPQAANPPGAYPPAVRASPGGAARPAPVTGLRAQRDAHIPGIAVTASRTPRPAPARANAGLAVPRAAQARSAGNVGAVRASPAKARLVAWYQPRMPEAVRQAFAETASEPLAHLEPLYRDVAGRAGISWKVLAACDWTQCQASPRRSPVHGERLGQVNPDGSSYRTKSQALAQCAADLTELAAAVYGIDLACRRPLSVRALAEVFAAFRWGGLLARHGVSAMEFPYSVAGLTSDHVKMHWPAVDERDAPDKPGAKFKMPFGAVPALLSLGYPATR